MRRFASPTVDLLFVFGVVFLLQRFSGLFGLPAASFALMTPLERPWTVVTSVYAHAGFRHLLTNAVALVLVGFALERYTTRFRFHAFVLLTGSVAGLLEYFVSNLLGPPSGVIGASGAILALYGYLLAGNPITGGLLSRLEVSRRGKLLLVGSLALLVTLATAGNGVALLAHFSGFALGLISGRMRVLSVR